MGKKKSRYRKKFLFIFSLFFVLLIFLVGVEVGQHFSEMSLKGQNRNSKKQHFSGDEHGGAEVKKALDDFSEEGEPETKITFYDDLQEKSKNGSVNSTKFNRSEESVRQNEITKKENSVPSSEDSAINPQPSKYALQLGSYKVRSQAEELERELKNKGYHAYIVVANLPKKGVWYRVKIGDYEDLEKVRQVASDLKKKEGASGIIISVER